jgi:hypothetical protein
MYKIDPEEYKKYVTAKNTLENKILDKTIPVVSVQINAETRMLEIIWHMLSNSEEYRTQNHELTLRKYKKMETKSQTS